MVLNISNSDNIVIEIPQKTFATVDSVSRVNESVDVINHTLREIDYVVETKTGLLSGDLNYGWYRKYKSGWVEQGGIANLSMLNATTPTAIISLIIPMIGYYSIAIAKHNGKATPVAVNGNIPDSFNVNAAEPSWYI
ncbi:MAG: hypothetical protein LBQ34_03875 [Alphaproteobacteria bacterium]|nr:hypothetical protein [Alphaproteobacteria bacterium]